jgi:hypothetical protein
MMYYPFIFAFLLVGCVSVSTHAPNHTSLPSPILPTLGKKWIDGHGGIVWPPSEGFSSNPVPLILPEGMLIDRFGSPNGRFFSPKGADYSARALPYQREKISYTTYKVMTPIFVWVGKAAPWFDKAGGATQFETDATAAQLVADSALKEVAVPKQAPCGAK